MSMFCFQCQEAMKGTGCTSVGMCGKKEDVANLQDLLVYTVKGVAIFSSELRKKNKVDKNINHFLLDGLFSTITNANFDKQAIIDKIQKGLKIRDEIKARLVADGSTPAFNDHDAAKWIAGSENAMEEKAKSVGVLHTQNEDVRSLRELLTYGIKGMAAYTEHAFNLGFEDDTIYNFIEKGLLATMDDTLTAEQLVALVLECGQYGVNAMALLDKANTTRYGNPEITKVNIGVGTNPAILISGHDLRDMEDLLKQTEGTGVDVYTHSEMLPAHYYPAFKKYKHFVGNYGNAWWKQKSEFTSFNGPILFTTNCIVPPTANAEYTDRIYTTGASGLTGAKYIPFRPDGQSKDFTEIIEHAKKCKAPVSIEQGEIIGGFAHNQVLALADKVVDAVKSGAIKKFFVMAGCDGRHASRDY